MFLPLLLFLHVYIFVFNYCLFIDLFSFFFIVFSNSRFHIYLLCAMSLKDVDGYGSPQLHIICKTNKYLTHYCNAKKFLIHYYPSQCPLYKLVRLFTVYFCPSCLLFHTQKGTLSSLCVHRLQLPLF